MNWEFKRLADICEVKLGKTPSRRDKSFWDEAKTGSNVWVSIADLSKLNGRLIADSKEYISDKGASLFNPVKSGTLLMSFKLSIGKLAYAGRDLYTNEAIVALPFKNKNEIIPDFLYYYLYFYDWDRETENDVKLKGKTLNKAKLSEIKVPVPPLLVQQKIVDKLVDIFSSIDKASAAAEANIQNVNNLLSQVVSGIENSYEGVEKSLGSCVELLSGFAFKSSEYTSNNADIPLLRGDNLNPGFIDFTNVKRIDQSRHKEFSKYSLSLKDIVLGMDRPLISTGLRIAQVGPKDIPSLLVQRVMGMRCNKGINSDFLFRLLNSAKFIKHLVGEQTGLGVPHISGKTISSFMLKIPDLETQILINIRLKNIVDNANLYRQSQKKILNNWVSYKKAILRQAFNGELVKG